jgi:hypothetical protein
MTSYENHSELLGEVEYGEEKRGRNKRKKMIDTVG